MSIKVDTCPTRNSSFSLVAIFYLTALICVLLAIAVQATTPPRASPDRIAMEAAGTGILGGVLGGLIGLFHYRRLRGLSWGLLTGSVVGVCIGPVLSSRHYGQVMAACLGGSLLLVFLASVYRLNQNTIRRPPGQSAGGSKGVPSR